MGNPVTVCWIGVECTCRILGVSTAIVLCAVGVETLHQGEFHSLAIYLLVSSIGMMLFEVAYFLDALLLMCLPCPPDWQFFVLWGKMARIGGFQKFLYYSIMSLVCFLHPVLVWHAVIPGTMTVPGTMLLATALFNFVLSKKPQTGSPKGPQESYGDTGLATAHATAGGKPQSLLSFFHVGISRRGEGQASLGPGLGEVGESTQVMLDTEQTAATNERDRATRKWREWRHVCFSDRRDPVEREMQAMERYSGPEAETTSDTAPMIPD